MASCKPVLVPTDDRYQLQPAAIRAALTVRTRAVVTISPNNPTGAVYPESDLRAVNDLCREAGIYHIHDQAYEYFTYDGARSFSPASIAGSASHTISLFSLSKAYGFASWRIGYMVIPQPLLVSVKKIQDTLLICPPVISQYAALGALAAGRRYCEDRQASIRQARRLMLDELGALASFCEVPPAEGAFYFLLRLNCGLDSVDLAQRLVRQFGVAGIPGNAFGLASGCYLRVAYGALQPDSAREGIARLVRGLRTLCQ